MGRGVEKRGQREGNVGTGMKEQRRKGKGDISATPEKEEWKKKEIEVKANWIDADDKQEYLGYSI